MKYVMGSRASSVNSEGTCGASTRTAATTTLARLNILQQFLRREKRVKWILLRDHFSAAFLAVYDAERGNDLVAGFFRLLSGLKNRIACRTHIINHNHACTGLPVEAFDRAMHSVTFGFLSNDER